MTGCSPDNWIIGQTYMKIKYTKSNKDELFINTGMSFISSDLPD